MRALSYVPALRAAGFDVTVWAGGAASAMLGALGEVVPIETVAPGPALFRRIARRVGADVTRLRRSRPRLVLSDGDAPSTYAAAILGIPVIAVGHGLVFAYADVGPLPRTLLAREALNALSSSVLSRRQIGVHFAQARPRTSTVSLARIDVRRELDRSASPDGDVIAYFRDGVGEDWLAAIAARGVRVRWFTDRTIAPAGVTVESPGLDRFAIALSNARGVVGTAGSNLVAECRYLGIPLLALPDDGDVEQRLNARIGELDESAAPVVVGRLGSVSSSAVDRFVRAADDVLREGRHPDRLPDHPPVGDAVVAAVTSLLRTRAQRVARADSRDAT